MKTSNPLQQVSILRRVVLENDDDSQSEQEKRTEQADEDQIRFISSKSPIDPSSNLGFEDYLVNTYDDPQLTSQDTAGKHLLTSCIDNKLGGLSNRITLEFNNDTTETNLLDETSKFDKCLTPLSDYQPEKMTDETQMMAPAAFNNNQSKDCEGHSPYYDGGVINGQHETTKRKQHPFFFSQLEPQIVEPNIVESSLHEKRAALHELTTNASRNATAYQGAAPSESNIILKQSNMIGSGASFQNESSYFKSSENLHLSSNHVLQQQPQQSSHFITFKPNIMSHTSKVDGNGSPQPQLHRNPFPQKFKQTQSPLKEPNVQSYAKNLEDLSFLENVKKDSECYEQRPFCEITSPKVFSQHSQYTSAESTAGAQLTLSQLYPSANNQKSPESEQCDNFDPTQQIKFMPFQNNQLLELPSQIKEESQEYSYSYANVHDEKQEKPDQQFQLNTYNSAKLQETTLQSCIVNTQESNQVSPRPTTQQLTNQNSNEEFSASQNQLDSPDSLVQDHHQQNPRSVLPQALSSQQDQAAKEHCLKPTTAQEFVTQDGQIIDARAYISDGTTQDHCKTNLKEISLEKPILYPKKLLSETNNDKEPNDVLLNIIQQHNSGDNQDDEQQHIRSHEDHQYNNGYSSMLIHADNQSSNPKQQEYSDQMMLSLAQALLQKLNSQKDHFSNDDTLAQLTSISDHEEVQQYQVNQISEAEGQQFQETIELSNQNTIDEQSNIQITMSPQDQQYQQYHQNLQESDQGDIKSLQSSSSNTAKSLYEQRMLGIKNKRRQQQQSTDKKQFSSTHKKSKSISSSAGWMRNNQSQAQATTVINFDKKHVLSKSKERTVLENDSLYKRNMHWRKQLDDINSCKKQIKDHQSVLNEVKECTFTPTLVTKKSNISGTNQQHQKDISQLNFFHPGIRNPTSTSPTNKNAKPNKPVVVEDRCFQWACLAQKKKQQTLQRLQEFTECTFNPTLVAKEYKKRVCPSYEVKHKDRVGVTQELAQEYNYFTLKNYLKMNEDSKHDLERLCEQYSTTHGHQLLLTQQKSKGAKSTKKQKMMMVSLPPKAQQQLMSDQEKMVIIAEFVDRSDTWIRQVQDKKTKIAHQINDERQKENTFHPRIDPVSELLHARKMNQLHQERVSKASQMPLQQNLVKSEAAGRGDSVACAKNLFEYYMPANRHRQKSQEESQTTRQRSMIASVVQVLSMQQSEPAESHHESRPLQQPAIIKFDKQENKHPQEDETAERNQCHNNVDFVAESQKFNKLIEVLNMKLNEKPDISLPFQGDSKNEKKGDKTDPYIVELHRRVQSLAQSSLQNEQMSFCNQSQRQEKEIDVIEGFTNAHLMESSELRQSSQQISSGSEETSRFLASIDRKYGCLVKPLDLTQVETLKNNAMLTSHINTPTLTDPISVINQFQMTEQDQQSMTQTQLWTNQNNDAQLNHIGSTSSGFITTEDQNHQPSDLEQKQVNIDSFTQYNGNNSNSRGGVKSITENQSSLAGTSIRNQKTDYNHIQSQEYRILDGSIYEREAKPQQMSSSMRKHLDYIYKRQIHTSRCHQINDDQQQQSSQSHITASASNLSNLSNLSQVVRAQANIANAQRPSSCLEKVAYVEISQQQESERATFDNYKLSEPIEIGISSKTSQTNSRQPNHNLQAQSSSDNCLSQSNLTERKVRQHSNNTSGLFRKQNSKSPLSENASISHITPRTQLPNIMTSENIHNVILFEHLQYSQLDESTPTRLAKEHLAMEPIVMTARSHTAKDDPTICRLSQKLRGLKERESLNAPALSPKTLL